MKEMQWGFIGCGNMAKAMIRGMVEHHAVEAAQVMASDALATAMEPVQALGVQTTGDNKEVAAKSRYLVLAVKPMFYPAVIAQIAPVIDQDTVVVTIAAGQEIAAMEQQFGKPVKLIRTMPNTPAMVGEGMTAICPNGNVTEEELEEMKKAFSAFCLVEQVPERLMDAVTAVSGSSPAYVFLFIEAMADAAVQQGMPRAQAYRFAAQAVLGSAKMVLETGKHPGELKDMVCSPAGTTIAAVKVLEEKGFRGAVMDAMEACADVSKGMK